MQSKPEEEEIIEFFKECGRVVETRLSDKLARGYFAHVTFAETEDVDDAMKLDGHDLNGERVLLDFAYMDKVATNPRLEAEARTSRRYRPKSVKPTNGHTIWVGDIPVDVTEQDLIELFEQDCGKIEMICLQVNQLRNGQFGHIKFVDSEAVDKAAEKAGTPVKGVPLRLDFAEDKPLAAYRVGKRETGPESHRPEDCRTVWIGGLPDECTEEMIKSHFEKCGEISEIRVDRSKRSGTLFCHIEYAQNEAVDRAIKMSGERIEGSRIRVDFAENKKGKGVGRADGAMSSTNFNQYRGPMVVPPPVWGPRGPYPPHMGGGPPPFGVPPPFGAPGPGYYHASRGPHPPGGTLDYYHPRPSSRPEGPPPDEGDQGKGGGKGDDWNAPRRPQGPGSDIPPPRPGPGHPHPGWLPQGEPGVPPARPRGPGVPEPRGGPYGMPPADPRWGPPQYPYPGHEYYGHYHRPPHPDGPYAHLASGAPPGRPPFDGGKGEKAPGKGGARSRSGSYSSYSDYSGSYSTSPERQPNQYAVPSGQSDAVAPEKVQVDTGLGPEPLDKKLSAGPPEAEKVREEELSEAETLKDKDDDGRSDEGSMESRSP